MVCRLQSEPSVPFALTRGTTGVENSREHVGATAHAPVCQVERSEPLFDDQFLEDFEWALGDDGIFPLTEPYTSAW